TSDSRVDRVGVLRCQAVAYEVVVEPHETADNVALAVPAAHNAFDLAGSVVLIPQAGENRDRAEIPAGAGAVATTSGIGLQVHSVDCAGEFGVNLRNKARPIAAVVEGVGHYVIAQLA